MGANKALAPIIEGEFSITERPGSILDTPTAKALAVKLMLQWRGRTAGGYRRLRADEKPNETCRRSVDPDTGEDVIMMPLGKFKRGDLLLSDALQKVNEAIGQGLNPLSHIHIWYDNGVCLMAPHYQVMVGFLSWAHPHHSMKTVKMDDNDRARYGLGDGDAGSVTYILGDQQARAGYLEMMKFYIRDMEMDRNDALRAALEDNATASGIGVCGAGEHEKTRSVKARGGAGGFRADKRSVSAAIYNLVGKMPPGQLKQYNEQSKGIVLDGDNLKVLAEHPDSHRLSEGDQVRLLRLAGPDETDAGDMTQAQRVSAMRGDDFADADNDPAAGEYNYGPSPGDYDDADFDTDFGDDAAELEPVEVEEAQETPPPVRLEAMGYDDFIKEVHEANRGKKLTSARLEIATRKILAQEFPAIYKTDDDVTQAAGKALGGIIDKTAAFSTGQKAHEVYVLARDYAAGLDATK